MLISNDDSRLIFHIILVYIHLKCLFNVIHLIVIQPVVTNSKRLSSWFSMASFLLRLPSKKMKSFCLVHSFHLDWSRGSSFPLVCKYFAAKLPVNASVSDFLLSLVWFLSALLLFPLFCAPFAATELSFAAFPVFFLLSCVLSGLFSF